MQPPDFHYHNGPHWWCPEEHASTLLVVILAQGSHLPTAVPLYKERQRLTQRHRAPEASSYRMCHDQRWQQTFPCWGLLCPFWGNACWSLLKKARFGVQRCLSCSWGVWSVVGGTWGPGPAWLLWAWYLPRAWEHSHWMMASKSRYNEVTLWKVKSVQCKVDVLGFEENKEKKNSLLPL